MILGIPTKLVIERFKLKKNKVYKIKKCKKYNNYLKAGKDFYFLEYNLEVYFKLIEK